MNMNKHDRKMKRLNRKYIGNKQKQKRIITQEDIAWGRIAAKEYYEKYRKIVLETELP